jgi:hypothetical protein
VSGQAGSDNAMLDQQYVIITDVGADVAGLD